MSWFSVGSAPPTTASTLISIIVNKIFCKVKHSCCKKKSNHVLKRKIMTCFKGTTCLFSCVNLPDYFTAFWELWCVAEVYPDWHKKRKRQHFELLYLFSHTSVRFSESVLIIQTNKQIWAKFKESLSSGTITGIAQKIQDVFVGIRCRIILPQLASMTLPELNRIERHKTLRRWCVKTFWRSSRVLGRES